MTNLKTEINGKPFEIEIDDGLALEFSAGKLKVRNGEPGTITYSASMQGEVGYIDFGTALERARV